MIYISLPSCRYYLQPLPEYLVNIQEHHIENDIQDVGSKADDLKSKWKKTKKIRPGKKKTRGRKTSKSSKSSRLVKEGAPHLDWQLWSLDKVINFDSCDKRIVLQVRKQFDLFDLINIFLRLAE